MLSVRYPPSRSARGGRAGLLGRGVRANEGRLRRGRPVLAQGVDSATRAARRTRRPATATCLRSPPPPSFLPKLDVPSMSVSRNKHFVRRRLSRAACSHEVGSPGSSEGADAVLPDPPLPLVRFGPGNSNRLRSARCVSSSSERGPVASGRDRLSRLDVGLPSREAGSADGRVPGAQPSLLPAHLAWPSSSSEPFADPPVSSLITCSSMRAWCVVSQPCPFSGLEADPPCCAYDLQAVSAS